MSAVVFRYRAVDEGGRKRRGSIEASDRAEAFRLVAAQGLFPLEIKDRARTRVGGRRRVRAKEIAHFTYQFSVLINARIPIAEGLRSISAQETNRILKGTIEDLATRIESGGGIADSMAAHGDIFGEIYVETVRAAEQSGNMIKILEYLAEMLERAEETRRQIRASLAYPVVVVTVLTLATSFLIAFVVPRFGRLFAARGIELPLITRVLVMVGEVFNSYWWAILAGIAGSVLVYRWARRRPQANLVIDSLLHRIPLIREVLVSLGVARFARVFGLCLASGLGLIDCLAMSGRASGRPMLERDVSLMIDRVREGGRLSDVLSRCEYLPPFARRMLSAGEESAEITRMCTIVACQHERDAESLAKGLSTVIEPLLVVLIAGVVLLVALAIFLPMWNMVSILG